VSAVAVVVVAVVSGSAIREVIPSSTRKGVRMYPTVARKGMRRKMMWRVASGEWRVASPTREGDS